MNKWKKRLLAGKLNAIWWYLMPGTTVKLTFLTKFADLGTHGIFDFIFAEPFNPETYVKPWLDENVGLQGWDWDWRVTPNGDFNTMEIKFRIGKGKYASLAALTWA